MYIEMKDSDGVYVDGEYVSSEEFCGALRSIRYGGVFHAPEPRKVIYSGPATVALWDDGTKTVVKCAEGDAYDPAKAYLEAFFRKATGWTRSRCRRELERITRDAPAFGSTRHDEPSRRAPQTRGGRDVRG